MHNKKYMIRIFSCFRACGFVCLLMLLHPAQAWTAISEISLETLTFQIPPLNRDVDLTRSENGFYPLKETDFVFIKQDFALASGHRIVLRSTLFNHAKDDFLTSMISGMERREKAALFGLGVTGQIIMPVLAKENWSLTFNGTVSGSHHEPIPLDQRTRWNLEYQIGGRASYHFTQNLDLSIGAYQYHIINHQWLENPKEAYTTSHGGFISLQLHF